MEYRFHHHLYSSQIAKLADGCPVISYYSCELHFLESV